MRKQKCMAAGLLAISIASMSLLSGCELIDNVKNGVGTFFSSIFPNRHLEMKFIKKSMAINIILRQE